MNPIIDRDEKGHIRHKRCGDGTERWYDASENLTHERRSDGDEG